jgi:hypothetical protein
MVTMTDAFPSLRAPVRISPAIDRLVVVTDMVFSPELVNTN